MALFRRRLRLGLVRVRVRVRVRKGVIVSELPRYGFCVAPNWSFALEMALPGMFYRFF